MYIVLGSMNSGPTATGYPAHLLDTNTVANAPSKLRPEVHLTVLIANTLLYFRASSLSHSVELIYMLAILIVLALII